jgi:hypothetical protein
VRVQQWRLGRPGQGRTAGFAGPTNFADSGARQRGGVAHGGEGTVVNLKTAKALATPAGLRRNAGPAPVDAEGSRPIVTNLLTMIGLPIEPTPLCPISALSGPNLFWEIA